MFIDDFKHALNQAGIGFNDSIIADGQLHRFHIEGDKSGKKNGWYVLYDGNIPAGAFGCWKRGVNKSWCSKHASTLSTAEKSVFQEQVLKAKLLRERETQDKQYNARMKAEDIWLSSRVATHKHRYLIKKHVKNHGLRLYKNSLVVPMMDIEGIIHSLQFIDETGEKRFLSGGRKKGCFWTLGSPHSTLNIAEGYSTAATIYECTGIPTAIAFDAGNLIHVAKAWRSKCPELKITICADNDTKSPINTGVIKAKEAAVAVDGFIAIPPCHGDFNDFYNGAVS